MIAAVTDVPAGGTRMHPVRCFLLVRARVAVRVDCSNNAHRAEHHAGYGVDSE